MEHLYRKCLNPRWDSVVSSPFRMSSNGRLPFESDLGSKNSFGSLSYGICKALLHKNMQNFHHGEVLMLLCAKSLSRVWFFVNPWTVASQAPLSLGFSRQEYWSGLPCPPPGDLPDPGIKPVSLMPPALTARFFTTSATWKACEVPKTLEMLLFSTVASRHTPPTPSTSISWAAWPLLSPSYSGHTGGMTALRSCRSSSLLRIYTGSFCLESWQPSLCSSHPSSSRGPSQTTVITPVTSWVTLVRFTFLESFQLRK